MQRRQFLKSSLASGISIAGSAMPLSVAAQSHRTKDLDKLIAEVMKRDHLPGLAAAVFDATGVIWSKSYGYSNLERKQKMTLNSVQNIGSVSKTFVATAAMQLKELGLLDLDADINSYLGFDLRNPNHPNKPITMRQLLTHQSSLRDGYNYAKNYACGDPRISIAAWVRAFFKPGNIYYDRDANFENWAPGEGWYYCNVSWSVAALIVERISGIPFPAYCHRNIFSHLGMVSTNWLLADIDKRQHSTPYAWVDESGTRGGSWGGVPLGVITPDGPTLDKPLAEGLHENCLYNHPNYPDGFLRSCVSDLLLYLRAYANGGLVDGKRILQTDTVAEMLTVQIEKPRKGSGYDYGMTWRSFETPSGKNVWGHSGGDPGVSTEVAILPKQKSGGVIVANSDGVTPEKLMPDLLEMIL
ncbi:MAG: serine hydrolase [Pseudomonadota bacterium]